MNVLETYFKDSGDTPAALARRIGREPSTITRVARAQRGASSELAKDIERGTAGKVTALQVLGISLGIADSNNPEDAAA